MAFSKVLLGNPLHDEGNLTRLRIGDEQVDLN
jgi:hypothetical protein